MQKNIKILLKNHLRLTKKKKENYKLNDLVAINQKLKIHFKYLNFY